MITDEQLEAFLERVKEGARQYWEDNNYTEPLPEYSFTRGKVRIKIIMDGSAWGFVDPENGDLYKPASWSAPAKHIRGNILTSQYGFDFGWTGPRYLK